MKIGVRKVWIYLITFLACMGINVYAIIKGCQQIPFDGNFVFLIFTSFVGGTTAEHFVNKNN